MAEAVLLDTCACLWLVKPEPMAPSALRAIEAAQAAGGVWVSAITAWEVATLVRKSRYRLAASVTRWFDALLALPGIRLAALDPALLIASVELPGAPPADPADRMVIATARALGVPVVTRDRRILAYAGAGYVAAWPC